MQMNSWLVLCNETQAQIYDISSLHKELWEAPADASLIKTLENPAGALKDIDLVTDRPGHFQKQSPTRGQYEPHKSPHENVIEQFAISITHFLETALNKNDVQYFVLCAEPHFYGMLRQHFSEKLDRSLLRVIQKDYLNRNTNDLKDLIQTIRKETIKELASIALEG